MNHICLIIRRIAGKILYLVPAVSHSLQFQLFLTHIFVVH